MLVASGSETVTVQVGTRNEPKTASMPVIASPSILQDKLREAISCPQSLERGDCFVAPLLAMTPPERLRETYVKISL
jgi:hypothetical protein